MKKLTPEEAMDALVEDLYRTKMPVKKSITAEEEYNQLLVKYEDIRYRYENLLAEHNRLKDILFSLSLKSEED